MDNGQWVQWSEIESRIMEEASVSDTFETRKTATEKNKATAILTKW
jgi:hypothetical protein